MASALFNITCVAVFVALVAVTSVQSQNFRASLGSSCSNYSQCANTTFNSYCSYGRCQCQSSYVQLDAYTCSLPLGRGCSNNTQCLVLDSYCNSSRVCGCIPGYVQRNASCVWGGTGPTTAKPTTNCAITGCAFLGGGGYCNTASGNCYCRNGFILERNYCYYIRGFVGDSCNIQTDLCYLRNGSKGVECNNGKCKCMKGYKESTDKRACSSATTLMTATSITILMLFSWMLR